MPQTAPKNVEKAAVKSPSDERPSRPSVATARVSAKRPVDERPLRSPTAPARPTAAADERAERPRAARKPGSLRTRIIAVAVIVIVVAAGLFAWQRWFRYDDAADFQGVWKVNAANETMVIDATKMNLVHGVSYAYTLDTMAKTVTFNFADLVGAGSYHFSGDRSTLIINEGSDSANILVQLGLMDDPALTSDTLSDSTTILTKISKDTTATPQSLANNTTESAQGLGAAIVSGDATQSTSSDATAASSGDSSSASGSGSASASASSSTGSASAGQ